MNRRAELGEWLANRCQRALHDFRAAGAHAVVDLPHKIQRPLGGIGELPLAVIELAIGDTRDFASAIHNLAAPEFAFEILVAIEKLGRITKGLSVLLHGVTLSKMPGRLQRRRRIILSAAGDRNSGRPA